MARSGRTTLGAFFGLLAMAGGCSALSGASDLTIDRSGAFADGGAETDAPADAAGDSRTGLPNDGASTRLREVTFESGLLVGKDGADAVTGMATPFNAQPLRGSWSMLVTDGKQFVDVKLPAPNEIYVTFLFGIASFPAGDGEATIASFSFEDASEVVDFRVTEHMGSALAVGGLRVSILTVLEAGTIYRAGLHVRTNTQGTLIEANVATAQAAFDPKNLAMISAQSHGAVTRIELGAIGLQALTGAFDQLLVDTATMPPP